MKDCVKEYVFRKVKVGDAEDFIRHVNRVWRMTYENIFPKEVFDKREENVKKKIDSFKERVVKRPQSLSYIVETEGHIVATMTAILNSNYDYFNTRGYADLESIYVDPLFEGHHIATHLKDLFIDWVKQNGAKKFVIGVLKDNIKARQVYEHWGGKLSDYTSHFEIYGVITPEVFYEFDVK